MEPRIILSFLAIIVLGWISFILVRSFIRVRLMECLLKSENNDLYVSIGAPVWGQPTRDRTRSVLTVLFIENIDGVGDEFVSRRKSVISDLRRVKQLTICLAGLAIISYVI